MESVTIGAAAASTEKPGTPLPKDGTTTTVTVQQDGVAAEKPKEETLIAGKFKTQDDLLNAYKALEAKLGQPKTETPKPAESVKGETPAPVAELDITPFAAEVLEKGTLSEDSLKALETAGIPRKFAQAHVRGLMAEAREVAAALATVAGGKEQLDAIGAWAKANADTALLSSFEAAKATGNLDLTKTALKAIVDSYTAANGSDPSLLSGGTAAATKGVLGFPSQKQMTDAINDKRYDSDPAYRAEVMKRIVATSMSGA